MIQGFLQCRKCAFGCEDASTFAEHMSIGHGVHITTLDVLTFLARYDKEALAALRGEETSQ